MVYSMKLGMGRSSDFDEQKELHDESYEHNEDESCLICVHRGVRCGQKVE